MSSALCAGAFIKVFRSLPSNKDGTIMAVRFYEYSFCSFYATHGVVKRKHSVCVGMIKRERSVCVGIQQSILGT